MDLLGKVEWFLVLQTQAQDLISCEIDRAVCVYIQLVPPSALSLLEVELHLEFILWRPYPRLE